jgi:hypothetical protein
MNCGTKPHAWDLELKRFPFGYCVTAGRESSSPFSIMFVCSPVSHLEDDKENHNVTDEETSTETLSMRRRRLQSSILQVSLEVFHFNFLVFAKNVQNALTANSKDIFVLM